MRAIIAHSFLSLLFLCTGTLYRHETYLTDSVRVTLQYKPGMLGKQSVMFKIMHNKMFIIFYILRLTTTLKISELSTLESDDVIFVFPANRMQPNKPP